MTTRWPKEQQKGRGPASSVPNVGGVGSGGSFLWTLMLCGLATTLLNVFFEAGTTLEPRHHVYSRFDSVQGKLVLDEPPNAYDRKNDPVQSEKLSQVTASLGNKKNNVQGETGTNFAASGNKAVEGVGKMVDWNALDPALVRDKGPLLDLVRDAGNDRVDVATLHKLPSWSDVAALYGSEPIFLGYPDECTKFQNSPQKAYHFIATAGTFNTGTNLMSELLIANCHMPEHEQTFGGAGVRWQVQWGKHTPVDNETLRLTHRSYSDPNYQNEYIFPVVMVRDPYKWMQSMCRHYYAANWNSDPADPNHCPNLVAIRDHNRHFMVQVHYANNYTRIHDSLVHFWNEWYQAYNSAAFPHLVVRFEDLIYHPKEVVEMACTCAGGKLRKKFTYIVESAKKGDEGHGEQSERTSYMDALSRYGTKRGRYKGFLPIDLGYMEKHVNLTLMKMFGYPMHQDANTDAGT